MRLPQTKLGRLKNLIHALQAALVLLCIILTIAVFVTAGSTDGRTAWFFGLCWLTIPLLIYQTMVPAWSRAKKFSNIYVFAVVDGLSVVLWLSAWASVTSYVVSGKGRGTNTKQAGCNNFKYGSTIKCEVSEITIILGVTNMILFIATAFISSKTILKYRRTGVLPYETIEGDTGPLGDFDQADSSNLPEDEGFNTNVDVGHDYEVDEYDHDDYDVRYGGDAYRTQIAVGH